MLRKVKPICFHTCHVIEEANDRIVRLNLIVLNYVLTLDRRSINTDLVPFEISSFGCDC